MKRSSFLFGALFALLLIAPTSSQAAAAPGSLIKGSTASLYYLGEDNKRYVFPTEGTYKTWYGDFSSVQTISDEELRRYPLGGNVTYRPGVRLVKITTDPKVYAVARGGALRWLETEAVARALYGDTWARQIDDIPDTFFINYRVSASVRMAGDFSPTAERDAVTYIGANHAAAIPTPSPLPTTPPPSSTTSTSTVPTPSSTRRVILEVTPTAPRFGTTATIRAEASPANVTQLKVYFNDTLQRTCEYYVCSFSVDIPLNSTQSTFPLRAEVRFDTGDTLTQTTTLVPQAGSAYLILQLSRKDLEPSSNREIIARATSDFVARELNIFVDGAIVKSCVDQQECRYSAPETSPIGTTHLTHIVATNNSSQTVRSETQSFSVVANDSPTVGVTPGKTAIFVRETIDVRVSAADDDGIQETSIILDGQVMKTCSLPNCEMTLGPWSEPRLVEIVGRAKDSLGAQSSVTSSAITVR